MSNTIEISGQITRKDFIRFSFVALRKKLFLPIMLYVVGVLILIVFYAVSFFELPSQNIGTMVKQIDPTIYSVFVFPVVFCFIIYFSSRYAFSRDTLIRKKRTYLINEEGISCVNENSNSRIPWQDAQEWMESKQLFLVFLSSRNVFPIPKHFMNADEVDKVRDILKTGIVKKKKGISAWIRPMIYAVIIIGAVWYGIESAGNGNGKARQYYEEGYKKDLAGDYKGALELFNKAIKEDPTMAAAYNNRGYAKAMLHNITGQLEDCSKAIALDSNYANAYLGLGYAKYSLGDSTGACEAFQKAVALGDKDAKAQIGKYCK